MVAVQGQDLAAHGSVCLSRSGLDHSMAGSDQSMDIKGDDPERLFIVRLFWNDFCDHNEVIVMRLPNAANSVCICRGKMEFMAQPRRMPCQTLVCCPGHHRD